jgi:hypothetical protein
MAADFFIKLCLADGQAPKLAPCRAPARPNLIFIDMFGVNNGKVTAESALVSHGDVEGVRVSEDRC